MVCLSYGGVREGCLHVITPTSDSDRCYPSCTVALLCASDVYDLAGKLGWRCVHEQHLRSGHIPDARVCEGAGVGVHRRNHVPCGGAAGGWPAVPTINISAAARLCATLLVPVVHHTGGDVETLWVQLTSSDSVQFYGRCCAVLYDTT